MSGGTAAGFAHRMRVYYQHTDAAGVVYHSNYLAFMEAARTERLRQHRIDLGALEQSDGVVFVVRQAQVHFRRPARLDDLIEISAEPSRVGRAHMLFAQVIRRDNELLVEASVELACVNPRSWRPVGVQDHVRHALMSA